MKRKKSLVGWVGNRNMGFKWEVHMNKVFLPTNISLPIIYKKSCFAPVSPVKVRITIEEI